MSALIGLLLSVTSPEVAAEIDRARALRSYGACVVETSTQERLALLLSPRTMEMANEIDEASSEPSCLSSHQEKLERLPSEQLRYAIAREYVGREYPSYTLESLVDLPKLSHGRLSKSQLDVLLQDDGPGKNERFAFSASLIVWTRQAELGECMVRAAPELAHRLITLEGDLLAELKLIDDNIEQLSPCLGEQNHSPTVLIGTMALSYARFAEIQKKGGPNA